MVDTLPLELHPSTLYFFKQYLYTFPPPLSHLLMYQYFSIPPISFLYSLGLSTKFLTQIVVFPPKIDTSNTI